MSLAVSLGFWHVFVQRVLEDWCVRRCLKLHLVYASVSSAVHVHMVVIGFVVYGSVKGVCGSTIARVVPTRAIVSLSMSPVDFFMSVLVVWLLMAVLVRVF